LRIHPSKDQVSGPPSYEAAIFFVKKELFKIKQTPSLTVVELPVVHEKPGVGVAQKQHAGAISPLRRVPVASYLSIDPDLY
jgi:hypothetical protein